MMWIRVETEFGESLFSPNAEILRLHFLVFFHCHSVELKPWMSTFTLFLYFYFRQHISYASQSGVQTQHACKCKNNSIFRLRIRTYASHYASKNSEGFPVIHRHVRSCFGVKRWGYLWLCSDGLLECSLTSDCLETLCALSHAYL